MQINTNNLVSITQANQNFSKVARLVDENGVVIILKNNTPRYVIMEYSSFQGEEFAKDADVKTIGEQIVNRNLKAFMELAKWKKLTLDRFFIYMIFYYKQTSDFCLLYLQNQDSNMAEITQKIFFEFYYKC